MSIHKLLSDKRLWFKSVGLSIYLLIMFGAAPLHAQNIRISVNLQNVSLESALTRLVTEYNIPISFNPALLPAKRISRLFIKSSIRDILDYVFFDTGLTYRYADSEFIIVEDVKNEFVLSGHVRDSETGENIIGATIFTKTVNNEIESNNYGYYALTSFKGDYIFSISHIGYKLKTVYIRLNASTIADILLEKKIDTLHEIKVAYSESNDTLLSPRQGISLTKNFISANRSLGGEADIIKDIRLQTGVVGNTEGSGSLYVRGGNKDQNLVLMDEATVYNPSHLFGLVSIFNAGAISNVQIYKDEMPANFGGRLSSVIDVTMLEGNKYDFHVKGGINLLSGNIGVEGPIEKDKGSYLITFRRGLTDIINTKFKLFNIKASFYDLNAKLNYTINANNRVFLSSYTGYDDLISNNAYKNNWGNTTATLRWNHLFNSRLFSNLSAIYSDYTNKLDIDARKIDKKFNWITGIQDWSLKGDFSYYLNQENTLKFGFNGIYHRFTPGESPDITDSIHLNIPKASGLDLALYFSHNLFIGEKLQINYGLRSTLFRTQTYNSLLQTGNYLNQNKGFAEVADIQRQNDEIHSSKTFINFEPRAFVQYRLSKYQRLHLAFDFNVQYLQLVQNNELSYSSLETWMPSSVITAPQKSYLTSVGYKFQFHKFILTIDGYYKFMYNQLTLIDHAQIILNPMVEHQLRAGNSIAYGTELSISKSWNKLSSSILYTYSNVQIKIGNINGNKKYQANYNIPHDLRFLVSYQFTARLSINSVFVYRTGNPVTLPLGYYTGEGKRIPIFGDRNTFRFPNYNRLDFSLVLNPKSFSTGKRGWESYWVFSVYNALNKKSPIFFSVEKGARLDNVSSGIVPSLSYNFKF